jgi:hypothetical protein
VSRASSGQAGQGSQGREAGYAPGGLQRAQGMPTAQGTVGLGRTVQGRQPVLQRVLVSKVRERDEPVLLPELVADDEHVSSLPKRVPGAGLEQPVEPPDGGWFGTPVEWPTEDEDLIRARDTQRVLAHYLDGSDLPDGQAGAALFDRVLDGIKRLGP